MDHVFDFVRFFLGLRIDFFKAKGHLRLKLKLWILKEKPNEKIFTIFCKKRSIKNLSCMAFLLTCDRSHDIRMHVNKHKGFYREAGHEKHLLDQ
jgi:hypothetical protein